MNILYNYLKKYWKLCLAVLVLASINQVFSLLDPYIFSKVVDNYALRFSDYTLSEFLKGVSYLMLLGVGVAFVSYYGGVASVVILIRVRRAKLL